MGAILAFLVLGASVVVDLIYPGTFSVRSYRPAGLTTDANVTALALLMILPFCLRYERFHRTDISMIMAAFALVMLTLSRSGMFMWLMSAMLYVVAAGWKRPLQTLMVVFGFGAAVLALILIFADVVSSLAIAKLPEVGLRLDQLLGRSDVLADDYRPALLDYFLQLALQNPLAGQGTGYTLGIGVSRAHSNLARTTSTFGNGSASDWPGYSFTWPFSEQHSLQRGPAGPSVC